MVVAASEKEPTATSPSLKAVSRGSSHWLDVTRSTLGLVFVS